MHISPAQIRKNLSAYYTHPEAGNIARLICCEILGQCNADYYLNRELTLPPEQAQRLDKMLLRLQQFEPIQYIIGEARFLGRTFRVTPDVLIPRPETEELVEWILEEISPTARILDIGTGSGCIAVSLSKELPDATVEAWDVSDAALNVARGNSERLQAEVRFTRCDILGNIPKPESRYDFIVSNPPYVTESEKPAMEPNVLQWEPAVALFVPDADPLLFYRRMAVAGHGLLRPGGRLCFEINRSFGSQTVEMLYGEGYRNIILRKDISHNDRFILAQIPL